MNYQIKRECWNDKTYNGYTDNPYWQIIMHGNTYGLSDNGKLWSIDKLYITEYTKQDIQKVINECNINISLIN